MWGKIDLKSMRRLTKIEKLFDLYSTRQYIIISNNDKTGVIRYSGMMVLIRQFSGIS